MTKGIDKLIQLEKQGKVRIDRQQGTVEILAKNKSEERKIINSFSFLDPRTCLQVMQQSMEGDK
jgi:murein L,D-transpeptidase YafK